MQGALGRQNLMHFRTTVRYYGVTVEKTISFDLGAARVRRGSWIYEALEYHRSRSQLVPGQKRDLGHIFNVLGQACTNPHTRRYLVLPVGEVGRRDARDLFAGIENLLESSLFAHLSETTKKKSSSLIRTFLAEKLPEDLFAERISRCASYFQTRFRGTGAPRKTLSESPHRGADPENPVDYPLGAIPHQTIAELRNREVARMTQDINKLVESVTEEMQYWHLIRQKMNSATLIPTSSLEMAAMRAFLLGSATFAEMSRIQSFDPSHVASCIIQLVNDVRLPRRQIVQTKLRFGNVNDSFLTYFEIERDRLCGLRTRYLFFLPRCALNRELIAAFYALLIHTRWNADSLRELRRSGVSKCGDIYTLQSFKSRSDRYTPEIDIIPDNKAAYMAIELLLWNFEKLKEFKHLFPEEDRLWFGWDNKNEQIITRPISDTKTQKLILLEKIGMDWFSDEQIRTHMLTLDNFKLASGIEMVQLEADHADVNMTVHYISQIATILHNQAINLEFQRRFDASVKFSLSKERSYFVGKFDQKKVDKNLLFPIGDGTGCRNPFEPVEPSWLIGGVCDAKNCHADRGCANNRIVIGRARVREVWTTSNYYARNWKRLLNENAEAFEKWHGPAMLFNLLLKTYIKKSLYWFVISPLVKDLEVDDAGDKTSAAHQVDR
ncbi:hypothetical protein KZJ38_21590 [Paraburkholderia edwinii]|uniref:Uncharacterized protein n=1 Tax=Paraburkholderia edwinii TaxID=2861782 RepID=A0ABX8UII2_9BURK|nr:hypothetical protein [Paraburkholderia edwinii]QYD68777.1 hypothetical protein KZJ38_21590 [Paraburkholderia edwinii]